MEDSLVLRLKLADCALVYETCCASLAAKNHLGFVRVGLADPCLIQHWVADYRYPGFSFNGINVQIAFEYFGWVQLLEFWRKFVSCPQA